MFETKNCGRLSAIKKNQKTDWIPGWFHLQHMPWQLLSTVLNVLQIVQWSGPFGFCKFFQEAWPMLIIKKVLLKKFGFSRETLSVVSLAWVLHLHFCLGWSGEKLFYHQEQTCIFKALWVRAVESCFLLCPKGFDFCYLSYKDYIFHDNS